MENNIKFYIDEANYNNTISVNSKKEKMYDRLNGDAIYSYIGVHDKVDYKDFIEIENKYKKSNNMNLEKELKGENILKKKNLNDDLSIKNKFEFYKELFEFIKNNNITINIFLINKTSSVMSKYIEELRRALIESFGIYESSRLIYSICKFVHEMLLADFIDFTNEIRTFKEINNFLIWNIKEFIYDPNLHPKFHRSVPVFLQMIEILEYINYSDYADVNIKRQDKHNYSFVELDFLKGHQVYIDKNSNYEEHFKNNTLINVLDSKEESAIRIADYIARFFRQVLRLSSEVDSKTDDSINISNYDGWVENVPETTKEIFKLLAEIVGEESFIQALTFPQNLIGLSSIMNSIVNETPYMYEMTLNMKKYVFID